MPKKPRGVSRRGPPVVARDRSISSPKYEKQVISQYIIEGAEVSEEAVILRLANKHTECLAPELCGLPAIPAKAGATSGDSCSGNPGCC